ncbi:MAG: hypothetical protein ACRDPK_12280 [Carbonactinosporaceae bacterium]
MNWATLLIPTVVLVLTALIVAVLVVAARRHARRVARRAAREGRPAPKSSDLIERYGLLLGAAGFVFTAVAAFGPGLARAIEIATTEKVCPWQYVVTDGVYDPVIISERPAKDSERAGTYLPNEIFYAPSPLQTRNGYLRTGQGWVFRGEWIVRLHDRPCRRR